MHQFPAEIFAERRDELRLRKDEEEVAGPRRAARVTVEGFRAAAGEVGPGVGE